MVTVEAIGNRSGLDGLAGIRAAIALGFSLTTLRQVKLNVR